MATTLIKREGADEATVVKCDRIGDGSHFRFEYSVGETRGVVDLSRRDAGCGVACIDGKVFPYHVVHHRDRVEVWLAGKRYLGQVVSNTAQRSGSVAASALSGDIKAAMPGTILSILVKAGQSFEAHQPLLIMESMKMEMTLTAPGAGTVREINCQVGELVEMGALLVRVTAGETG